MHCSVVSSKPDILGEISEQFQNPHVLLEPLEPFFLPTRCIVPGPPKRTDYASHGLHILGNRIHAWPAQVCYGLARLTCSQHSALKQSESSRLHRISVEGCTRSRTCWLRELDLQYHSRRPTVEANLSSSSENDLACSPQKSGVPPLRRPMLWSSAEKWLTESGRALLEEVPLLRSSRREVMRTISVLSDSKSAKNTEPASPLRVNKSSPPS